MCANDECTFITQCVETHDVMHDRLFVVMHCVMHDVCVVVDVCVVCHCVLCVIVTCRTIATCV